MIKILVFCCFIGIISAQSLTCFNGQPPSSKTLLFCNEYSGTPSCCSVQQDQNLGGNFTSKVEPLVGNGGCSTNAKALMCGWLCAPDQALFANFTFVPTGNSTLDVYTNATFYVPFYESCKNICYAGLGQIHEFFADPLSFLFLLSSFADPSFVPGPFEPIVSVLPGPYLATGGSFTHTTVPPSSQDIAPCEIIGGCPLAQTDGPAQQAITFCAEYASYSCCSPAQDALVRQNFNAKVLPLFGDEGCSSNIKKILCGFTCNPLQYFFVDLNVGNPSTMDIWVAQYLVDGLYNSCKDVCLPVAGGVVVKTQYPTAASFLSSLNSANDPSYIPSPTNPVITYHVGNKPGAGGLSLNASYNLPNPNELIGCTPPTTGSQGSNGITLVASFLFVLVSLLLAY